MFREFWGEGIGNETLRKGFWGEAPFLGSDTHTHGFLVNYWWVPLILEQNNTWEK